MTTTPHKIILDTDPGIDDAMAVFTVIGHADIELLGLTTVFGNVSVEQATQNALTLVEMSGSEVPVAMGSAQPLKHEIMEYPDFVHGTDGFGNLHLPPPQLQVHSLSAAEFMTEQINAQPGEITLVAVGPLTNLAHVLELDPSITSKVKQVVLMGGTLHESGNVSPVAEANIFCDPHAADRVMAADWPVVMVGLDVTHQVLLSRALFADIGRENPRIGPFMQQSSAFYIDFYERERSAEFGCFGHDVSAVAYVIDPELFGTQSGSMCVVTEGIARGQTILDRTPEREYYVKNWAGRPVQKACLAVDADKLVKLFHHAMTKDYWQAGNNDVS